MHSNLITVLLYKKVAMEMLLKFICLLNKCHFYYVFDENILATLT